MEFTWIGYGIHLNRLWNLPESVMEFTWIGYGIYLNRLWNLPESVLEFTWIGYGIFLNRWWNLPKSVMEFTLIGYGIYLNRFWNSPESDWSEYWHRTACWRCGTSGINPKRRCSGQKTDPLATFSSVHVPISSESPNLTNKSVGFRSKSCFVCPDELAAWGTSKFVASDEIVLVGKGPGESVAWETIRRSIH